MMIEGRVLKKCGMKSDMLSSLPDDVLAHILSFLPVNTSASTTILSRRWLHLWKYTTKLNFTNEKRTNCVNWVNSALKSHRSPSLREFTIDFRVLESNLHDVSKWLEFAFSRQVENLTLNFRAWRYTPYHDAPLLELPTSTGMRSLKSLCLVETEISGPAIQCFLGNCPVLEKLIIRDAVIASDLELDGPKLHCLDVEAKVKKNVSIKVSAPNLTMLTIGIDANRILRCSTDGAMHGFGSAESQLETPAIAMMDRRPKASFFVPKMPKLKKLVIDDRFPNAFKGIIVPFPVTSFLRASPCLEEFEIQITELVLEEGFSPVFQHASLKRFKMWWSCRGSLRDNYINLVRYVLDNCFGLEEIEISRCDDGTRWRSWFYVVVDYDSVREATMEERASFENTMQRKLPEHIKLRVANHLHIPDSSTPHVEIETGLLRT